MMVKIPSAGRAPTLAPAFATGFCPTALTAERSHEFPGASSVGQRGDGFQMIRVDASPVSAEMVDVVTAWDRSDPVLVGPTMSPRSDLMAESESSISSLTGLAGPEPTPTWKRLEILEESFEGGPRVRSHGYMVFENESGLASLMSALRGGAAA